MNILSGRSVLITGATGSFGNAFIRRMLAETIGPARIAILSRDEVKQADMRAALHDDSRLRWLLGDVRDLDRLRLAFRGVDTVIHAAAMKRVDACAYSPYEAVQTNIIGTWNVIRAAIDSGTVKRVVALSSDKACAPLNLYGKTKACLEDLCLDANAYSGTGGPMFSVVRYGNVAGSRGSVIPIWRKAIAEGRPVTVTDKEATRFWFTLDGAVDLVVHALTHMRGGELFVPKLPSFRVPDLAMAMFGDSAEARIVITEQRSGDKRHESMVSEDEAPAFRRHDPGFVRFGRGHAVGETLSDGFRYTSDTNDAWLSVSDLRTALKAVA